MSHLDDSLRHPLHWPLGQKRTPPILRKDARFGNTSIGAQVDELANEMRNLGCRSWLISSNLRMRNDGLPFSQQRMPDDSGIAVYFKMSGKDHVLACDRWHRPEHNLRAIVLHIAALRGQDRWGVGTLEQAFAGYAALPPAASAPAKREWSEVLGVQWDDESVHVKARYRALVKQHHPDAGGDVAAFKEVQAAWEEYCGILERAGGVAP